MNTNTQVPVITLNELSEYADFIIESLVARNRMSIRVTDPEKNSGDVLLVPVIEKSPIPDEVLADIEAMTKQFEQGPGGGGGLPPMPF
jgi:hypothetical protein